MSSVTQVKFEIKPAARKSLNTAGKSTQESIGNVASLELKQNTVGVKNTTGKNLNIKSEKLGNLNSAAGNIVSTGNSLKEGGKHEGNIAPVKNDPAGKSDLAVKSALAAKSDTSVNRNSAVKVNAASKSDIEVNRDLAVKSSLAVKSNSFKRNDPVVKRSESKRLTGITVSSAANQSDSLPIERAPYAENLNSKPFVKINNVRENENVNPIATEKKENKIPEPLAKSESVRKENEVGKKYGVNVKSASSQENVPIKVSKHENSLESRENSIKRADNPVAFVKQSSDGDKCVTKVKQDGNKIKIEYNVNSGSYVGSLLNSGNVSNDIRSGLNCQKDFKVPTKGKALNDNIKNPDDTNATSVNKSELTKKNSGLENNVKLDAQNKLDKSEVDISVEKKISNPMREMMLAQSLKDEIIKKGNAFASGKGSTMDLEKKLDLGEESVQEENVVEISIKGDKANDDADEPMKAVEPANMIDELQKYLLKRFGPVVNNIQETKEKTNFDGQEAKTDLVKDSEQSESQKKTELLTVNSNEVHSETIVKKAPISPDAVLPHPIFFKTSIKKDPGSKLHDQLLKELGSVLRKKEGKSDEGKSANKENEDGDDDDGKGLRKFPKRRVSAKGNKILGNKALLANLENQLQRTLHKNKIFQRQKLKVVDLETIEVNESEGQNVPSMGKDTGTETEVKSGAKLILDTEQLHKHDNEDDDNVMSAINQLDMSINEASSQSVSRRQPNPESSASETSPTKVTGNNESDNQEIFVYAFENKSGNTEGVICSVEKRVSMNDSLGRPRKYLTCINIVAEKDAVIDEGK